ncbi:MAG: hypothetical protein IPJ19_08870 [Planctomycetes bacterium]|nr:hypothetical protein [Planctomycetota bacterium]
MSQPTNAVCFTCGLVIETPPRLARLTNGQVCPACRERVLEGLPPALPSSPQPAEREDAHASLSDSEFADERDTDDPPRDWHDAS